MVKDLLGMVDVDLFLLWFCWEIKKDFVVSLLGECVDEIFGGYLWFYMVDVELGFLWMRLIEEWIKLFFDLW